MKLLKWALILILTASSCLYGQDTISVFFESGKYKIPEIQFSILNAIPAQFDLSALDSVSYTGIADSVGNIQANLKLSKKRAIEVKKYCSGIFPRNYLYKITALGEKQGNDITLNRRVDIVLYFKPDKTEEVNEPVPSLLAAKGCYYVDYALLHRAHKRVITKKKVQYVMLVIPFVKKTDKHYYGTITKNGELRPMRIKWQVNRTGRSWWATYNYVAVIPKKEYDNFKIFKINAPPCDSCAEDFTEKKTMVMETECLQVDRFLMHNIQVKVRWFNRSHVTIRAPREFVEISDKYFIGCLHETRLLWQTKPGRRHKSYYYARLPVINAYLGNITRDMQCCHAAPEKSDCNTGLIYCAGFEGVNRAYTLYAELGNHYQFSAHVPYAAIGIGKAGYNAQGMVLAGIDTEKNLHGALRYQYNFLSFRFGSLLSAWQSPGNTGLTNKYGRIYAGAEIKTRYNASKPVLLETNLHAGLSFVNTGSKAIIPRIFLQYGVGYDCLNNYASAPYGVLQLGIDFSLYSFGKAASYYQGL